MESLNNIKLKGLSCHVGSQISEMIIFEKVFNTMKEAASLSISKGIKIEYVDLGGGFAVNYNKNINDLNVKEIGRLTSSIFKDIPLKKQCARVCFLISVFIRLQVFDPI